MRRLSTLRVTAKGQITLRQNILSHLGAGPGEMVNVNKLPDGTIQIRAARPTGRISDIFGILKRKGQRRVSIKEMNVIVAQTRAGKR